MPLPKVYVDGFLLDWVDTLFFPEYKPAKTRVTKAKIVNWTPSTKAAKAAKARAQIDRTANKTPEVMVKITNKKGAGRGMKNIRNHLDYISRNGKLEMEDQSGNLVIGKKDIENLKEEWQYSSGRTIPEEGGRNRDTLNVIFSMAPGTRADKVNDAVREFLQDEFSGREYVFVLHTDTLHPHVHVCVKTAKTDELRRLNPNRRDLQLWREGFAEKLRDNGIEANATARRTRGQTRLPLKQADIHKAKRLKLPLDHEAIDLNKKPQFAKPEREAWKNITQTLSKSEVPSDVLLASKTRAFWQGTPYAIFAQQNINEKEIYVRTHNAERWELAATRIHQPNYRHSQTEQKTQAHPVPRVWALPSVNLESKPCEATSLLLYPNAPNYMGWRTLTDLGMRRTDIRVTEIKRGHIDKTNNKSNGSKINTPQNMPATQKKPITPDQPSNKKEPKK